MELSGDGPLLDLDRVVDLPELVEALIRLRAQAGNPSYRDLAKHVGPLLRPPRPVAFRTVAHLFQRERRRLDLDLLIATVCALGLDATQAKIWRDAYLRVHAEAATGGPTGVLRQLPADLPTFTGRREQLELLIADAAHADAGRSATVAISAIEGMGGVGKTQLAVHAAHRLVRSGRFGDAQLYVNLRGFDPDRPPADPSAVLDAFLRQLGVPAPRIPATREERSAMFRDALHGKQALVLLDNAADEDQVRDLIPAGSGCLVLITSRRTLLGLDAAATLVLDVLSPSEALELIGRIIGADRVTAELEAATAIARACGHLPLAVSVAAARLRSRPSWTLAETARRFAEEGMDSITIGRRNIRAVFDLSYRTLPDPIRRAYRLLGAFPGRDFAVPAAAALLGHPSATARAQLEDLMDEHLLRQQSPGRHEFHDLIREHAAHCLSDEDAEEQDAAARRLQCWYLRTADAAATLLDPHHAALPIPPSPPRTPAPMAFTDRAGALAWFEAERANLTAVTDAAAGAESAWLLAFALVPFHDLRTLWSDLIATHQVGLAAAQQLDDQLGQGWMHHGLARAYANRRDHEAAEQHYRRAIDAFGGAHPDGALRALGSLAALYGQLGDIAASIVYVRRALELARQLGNSRGEVILLGTLGNCHSSLGRIPEAVTCLQEAVARSEALGDVHTQGITLGNLAEVQGRAGNLDAAADCARRALDLQRQEGYRSGEARNLRRLADIVEEQGNGDTARKYRIAALTIYEDLGDPEAEEVRKQVGQD